MLLVTPLALALPVIDTDNPQTSVCQDGQLYNDTLANLGTSAVGLLNPIGEYNGVTYTGFGLGNVSIITGTSGGLVPHSPPDYAVSTVAIDVIQLGALTIHPFGTILAEPSTSFDLFEFWFGCSAASMTAQIPTVPVGCTIAVSGYDTSGNVVGVESFSFAPTNLLRNPTARAVLPDRFENLVSVTIGIAAGTLPSPLLFFIVDDVIHCNR